MKVGTEHLLFLVFALNHLLLPTLLFVTATASSGPPLLSSRVYTEDYTVSLRNVRVASEIIFCHKIPKMTDIEFEIWACLVRDPNLLCRVGWGT